MLPREQEVAAATAGGAVRRLHEGLAPAADAALRHPRRAVAGALRTRDVGRRAAPGPTVGGQRAQGDGPRGRLLWLQHAPPHRRGAPDRAARPAAGGGSSGSSSSGWPSTTASRRPPSTPSPSATRCTVPRAATAPVEVRRRRRRGRGGDGRRRRQARLTGPGPTCAAGGSARRIARPGRPAASGERGHEALELGRVDDDRTAVTSVADDLDGAAAHSVAVEHDAGLAVQLPRGPPAGRHRSARSGCQEPGGRRGPRPGASPRARRRRRRS